MNHLAMTVYEDERQLILDELPKLLDGLAEDDPKRATIEKALKRFTYHDYYAIPSEDDPETSEMIAALMVGDVLFYAGNSHPFVEGLVRTDPPPFPFYVLCNDIFAWGCADAEDIESKELPELYAMWYADPDWGSARWVCLKRNEQPQRPVIDLMKKNGSWDDVLEALPENNYDKSWRLHREAQERVAVEPGAKE